MTSPVYLTYSFRGFIFSFVNDHLEITDINTGKIYKLAFTAGYDFPFTITLVKQD